jgi:23S rRNA-/tRNA-specific pseudouridylate synthase
MEKLEIVYQDSEIVLLNKRAKILTVPGKDIEKYPNLTTLFKKRVSHFYRPSRSSSS